MSDEIFNRELRQLREIMVDALNRRDIDELLRHLEPGIVFTPLNNSVCHGIEAVRNYFERQMIGPDRILDDLRLTMHADDERLFFEGPLAVISGGQTGDYKLTNGMNISVTARWTATMARHDGIWRIAAFHASTNMFDNPLLNRLKKLAVWSSVLACLFGLIAGFMLAAAR